MDITSLLGDLFHLIVTVPVFGVGVITGALVYRLLLKKDPALLNSLIASAYAEVQKLAAESVAKANAAPVPASVTATGTAAAATVAAPVAVTPTPVVASSILQTIEADVKKL
jgi:hypothetical protein